MKLERYDYTAITDPETGRSIYLLPDGSNLPSVTSIERVTQSAKTRAILANWSRKNPGAREVAALRGTLLHETIEIWHGKTGKPIAAYNPALAPWYAFCNGGGGDATLPALVMPYWESISSWLPELQEIPLAEGVVWYEGLFAGRLDMVAKIQGEWHIVDIKTSDKPKSLKVSDQVDSYKRQIAAYVAAFNDTYYDSEITVKNATIAIAVKGQYTPQIITLGANELRYHYDEFLTRFKFLSDEEEEGDVPAA